MVVLCSMPRSPLTRAGILPDVRPEEEKTSRCARRMDVGEQLDRCEGGLRPGRS
jgi:hypothetical protein